MNTEEDSSGEKQKQTFWQTTMMLPYFDEEIPIVYFADGAAYFPVKEFCRILGLRAETYIPRWRKLVLWVSARKLPLQTARGQRIVWCLHLGALPSLCNCFNWSLVAPVRCKQLRLATDAWQRDVAQAQRLLLERYRAWRSYLLTFLVAYSDAEIWLDQLALHLSTSLHGASSQQLELLLLQGKTLIGEATAQARKIVQEQAMAPIFDILTLDTNGVGTEIGTLPLFPVIPSEDCEQFLTSLRKLVQWYQELAAFLDKIKRTEIRDQSEES